MKLLLKDFQADAVDRFVEELRLAAGEARRDRLQSVSLASPTGSGKTLMVTVAIERLLIGDDQAPPHPEATFLWLTDQPQLNEQTRQKMLEASTHLGPANLVVLDSAYDRESFAAGTVHFLNTQKLAKEANLVKTGDNRTYTLWDTVRNTVDQNPRNLFVFIDEAHRGMAQSRQAFNEANSIIQKFIKGSTGEVPAVPLIAGISATPDRFHQLISGTSRTERRVIVPPADVRDSGLLKERITLYHPKEVQPAALTLLGAAAKSWRSYVDRWRAYCEAEKIATVRPVMVIQVQDKAGAKPTATDLDAVIRAIDHEVGPLPTEAYAHAFQEGLQIELEDRKIRYLAPSKIVDDPDVQVVFFKTSLNTGWDCPRAEVMMSFRTAVDATLIAQLVGRMVRAPLARRIDADDHLNSVALYLPNYNQANLNAIIDRLTKDDGAEVPPVEVEVEERISLELAEGVDDALDALQALPSYTIPRARKTSQVRRLMKLSRLLANDGLLTDGPEKSSELLLGVLRKEFERVRKTPQFKNVVERKGKLDLRIANLAVYGQLVEAGSAQIDMAAANVNDLFEAAGRKLGEGLHKAWWKARVDEEPKAKTSAKLELFALINDSEIFSKVESAAQAEVQKAFGRFDLVINKLPEADRQAYDEVRRLAYDPELCPLKFPGKIQVRKAESKWQRHLYVDSDGAFPADFNTWEARVLTEELANPDVLWWVRNNARKTWALCVPYEYGGERRPLYPDFLIGRNTPAGLTVDLLDPHSVHLPDAPAKASGLALFATKHAHQFGRIELIIVEGKELRRLDLKDETVRNRVKEVKTREHLQLLFKL